MQSYGRHESGWQGGRRRPRPNPFVMIGGVIVAVLIVVLAGIGLVSVLSGDDESAPPTTLPQLTTTTASTMPTTTTTTEPSGTHIVQSGDSLFSIAEQYGIDLDALIAANPQITDPEDIDIGDEIIIPAGGSGPTTDGPADTGTDTAPDTAAETAAP